MIPLGVLGAATSSGGGGGGDPHWENVVSLLHFDGPNDSTVFTDQRGHGWSRGGNARIDTSQSRFGGSSLLLPGANGYLQSANTQTFNLLGDFTIEMWMRPASTAGLQYIFDFAEAGPSGNRPGFYLSGAGFELLFASTVVIRSTLGFAPGVWQHFTCERHGTIVRVYINGEQVGATGGSAFAHTAVRARLGLSVGGNFPFNGHIDEFRVTRAARYKGSFVPPTEPFPDGP